VWRNFIHFKSLIDKTAGLSVCLEIGEDLPDNVNFDPIFFYEGVFPKENYQSLNGRRHKSNCNTNEAIHK